jgi:hypothetical protein
LGFRVQEVQGDSGLRFGSEGFWFLVSGLGGFRVQVSGVSGLRVQGVYGLWFMVYGLWFMVYGLWFMVYGLGV